MEQNGTAKEGNNVIAWYKPLMALYLMIVLGIELMALHFVLAGNPAPSNQRITGLLLSTLVPCPWLLVAVGGYKVKRIAADGKLPNGFLEFASVYAVSMLGVMYSTLIIMGGNLFSCWR